MKQIFKILAIVGMALFFAACTSNSPEAAAEEAMEAVMNKDADKLAEMSYTTTTDEEELKAEREFLSGLYSIAFAGSGSKELVSFEILSSEVSEDGETAEVKVQEEYKNGKTDESTMKFKKNSNGDWKIVF